MTSRRKKPSNKANNPTHNRRPFPFELRLKVARLSVEDGHSSQLIAKQFGISEYSVYRWSKKYRLQGEQGLVSQPKNPTGSKLPAAVSQSIIDLKKENPQQGARRISMLLAFLRFPARGIKV
jgi:transposase-like protein